MIPESYPQQLKLSGLGIAYLMASDRCDREEAAHPQEGIYAQGLGHSGKRLEFLRSRSLLHRFISEHYDLSPKIGEGIHWPPGLVGSLTHKNQHIFCTLASSLHYRSIGIDLEQIKPRGSKLNEFILNPGEEQSLLQQSQISRESLCVLAFSAKEAIFKAVHPLAKKMFYFHDVELKTLDLKKAAQDDAKDELGRGSFTGQLKVDLGSGFYSGTFVNGEFVVLGLGDGDYYLSCVKFENQPSHL